ncbi:MAG: SurA N-terminal domain-containing protein [Beijerinckiaceae bacterium]|nr:SurA N-terminal domain-containing protein [Beijerinckiaceae bacterium]
MLQSMRASAQGWFGRAVMAVLMGLIILSFAIWGIGDIFRGFGANDLARVGNVEIGADTFRNAYQVDLQRQQRLERRNITNEEARQNGLDRQVLSRLVGDAALDDQARRLGLAMSDEDIKKAIMNDDNFKGMTGTFDRRMLDAFLREEGFTEKTYVQNQRAVYLRRQIVDSLTAGLHLPKALLEAIYRFQMEGRGVDYIVLPFSSVGPLPAPSRKELERYFEANQAFYAIPEYRSLVVLPVTPDSIAKPENVSDADAQTRYEEIKNERFGAPEKREIEQILYASEAEAKEAHGKLNAGKTFDDLLKEKNLTPKDASLGTVARSGLIDNAVADAAFSLKEGEVSAPVQAQFGTVILRAGKITPSTVKPYSGVAAKIKREIALQRAQAEIARLHDAIEDERTSGKTLTEAAQSAGLEPRVIAAIDASGNDPQGSAVPDLVDGPALMKATFASDIGVDNDTLRVASGGYQWFEVTKIDKPREKTLDEAKTEVEKAWREEEAGRRLTAKTAGLVKKLDTGESMEAIAAEEGNLAVKHASDVKRGVSSGLAANFISQIFNVSVNRAGSTPHEEGGAYLFRVTGSTIPPFDPQAPELTNIKADVKSGYIEDLVAQYLTKLEGDIGVKLNAKAFAAAAGVSPDNP